MLYRTIAAMSALLLCLTLSACSLLQKNVPTETQLPSDRHTVADAGSHNSYRSPALEKGDIDGDWIIDTVLGKPATGLDTPYLKFDSTSHQVYGSNGCNSLNAAYINNPADSTLSFSGTITTMRLCPGEDDTERAINTAMTSVARYTWGLVDDCCRLTLCDADMNPLMILSRQNFDFLNGTWLVSRIDGNLVEDKEMKLVLDISEMRVHGNIGCNILNGAIATDMAVRGSISFQNLATTRMTCPDINIESSLLVALEAATRLNPVDKNTVDFLNAHGDAVLRLVRDN